MAEATALEQGIRAAQSGDMQTASERFQAALATDPDNPDILHFAGLAKHHSGHSDEAIALIRRATEIAPTFCDAHSNLGNILKHLNRDDEALASYRTAIEHNPDHAPSLNNIGTMLRNAGKFEEAIEVLTHAVDVAPDMAVAFHNLGTCYAHSGELENAINAYYNSLDRGGDWSDPIVVAKVLVGVNRHDEAGRILSEYLERNPGDNSVRYQLAAVRGEPLDCADETYVTTQFDEFAESFDAVLGRLEYRAPELVADALAARLGEPEADRDILDLGCGTGLCGPLVAPYKSRLVGIDLSEKMLRRAVKYGVYDRLAIAELQAFLMEEPAASVDVALCVDTLVYIGKLERTVEGVRHILRPGGLFIATVERLDEGDSRDHTVDGSGRFKHSRRYIEALSDDGLRLLGMTEVVLRKEGVEPVHGYVFEMQRTDT